MEVSPAITLSSAAIALVCVCAAIMCLAAAWVMAQTTWKAQRQLDESNRRLHAMAEKLLMSSMAAGTAEQRNLAGRALEETRNGGVEMNMGKLPVAPPGYDPIGSYVGNE